MKIIGLDLNNNVLIGGMPEAYACLKDSIALLRKCKEVYCLMEKWSPESNVTLEVHGDMQLIACEELFGLLKTPGIDNYKLGSLSKYVVLFERLEHFQFYRDQLVSWLDEILDAYINLTDQEVLQIHELCYKILEQLSYFVYFEYNIDKTLRSVLSSEDMLVNEAFDYYCGREGRDINEEIVMISELFDEFKPTLPSVELDEDVIDNFYLHAGLHSYSILENIDALDIQDVKDIAGEVVSVEDVIMKLNQDDNKGVTKLEAFG